MDIYLEHMITKPRTAMETACCVIYYLVAASLTLLLAFVPLPTFAITFFPVIVFVLFWCAWKLARKYRKVEYEYILTNDELDVDRIIAKKERKRFLTVSVKKFEIMESCNSEKFAKYLSDSSIKVKFDASLGEGSENRYYSVFVNKKSERMLLVFNPTNEMLEAIRRFNMRNVFLEG